MLIPIRKIFSSGEDVTKFGDLLNQSWEIKKSLTDVISSTEIDNYYQEALDSGAIGGKLLGAGAGGFLLFYVPNNNHLKFKRGMKHFVNIPFKFEEKGSSIIKII